MKSKAKELEVDIIGDQNNPLTQEEQLAISTFIRKLKGQINVPKKPLTQDILKVNKRPV